MWESETRVLVAVDGSEQKRLDVCGLYFELSAVAVLLARSDAQAFEIGFQSFSICIPTPTIAPWHQGSVP
jgi:hypothetical protein